MSNSLQKSCKWTPQMQRQADCLRPPRTFADDVSDFMVTNPVARAYGLMYQGVADAGMNFPSYLARWYGLDTRPLEPKNAYERALELIPRTVYNGGVTKGIATAIAKGLAMTKVAPYLPSSLFPFAGSVGAGLGQKLGQKAIKIGKAALNPDWPTLLKQSVGGAGMEALINPESEWGKYAAYILGSALMPGSNWANLSKAMGREVPSAIGKKGLTGGVKESVKSLSKNPYARDFLEDDIIGEGAKRIVSNLLDPRASRSRESMSLMDSVRLSQNVLNTVPPFRDEMERISGFMMPKFLRTNLFGTKGWVNNIQNTFGQDGVPTVRPSANNWKYSDSSVKPLQSRAVKHENPFERTRNDRPFVPMSVKPSELTERRLPPLYRASLQNTLNGQLIDVPYGFSTPRQAAFDTFLRLNR